MKCIKLYMNGKKHSFLNKKEAILKDSLHISNKTK